MPNNADYHVLILAAGSSRRLAHLTQNKPKSFLDINGKRIIEHSLDLLNERGFKKVTFVVGYLRDLFMEGLGNQYKNLSINYVISEHYDTTEHGWSLYLTKDEWKKERKPVLFIDADMIYNPKLLDQVLSHNKENVSMVDNVGYKSKENEEELVFGEGGVITSFKRAIGKKEYELESEVIGEFVGINKFSSEFMGRLYDYMDGFFAKNGPKYKYERIFHNFISDTKAKINYINSEGLEWVNINAEGDYKKAKQMSFPDEIFKK